MRVVHGPHFIRTRRKRQRHSRFGSKSLAPPTLHRQPFLPVQPIHSLVVHPPPKRSVLGLLPSQENVQPPIAESRTLGCQLPQPSPQRSFVPFSPPVTPAPAVHPDQVALHFIERGKPTQNAFIESFNGKFRDECLNQNWFVDLRHAREVIEAWRVDYNTVRPHSSLRYLTPEEFAARVAARPASPPTPVVSIAPTWEGSDVQEPRSANL